jgi:anaerobic dimethyl sulfoxide reductase subunit A
MPLYDKYGNPILDRGGVSVITTATDPDAAIYSLNDPDHVPLPATHHTDWKNNFKDYILGSFDGVPKTPEWASERCGTPVEKIKILARAMGTIKPMAMLTQYASSRSYHGSLMIQAYYVAGWLTGNVGKPGAAVATYNDYLDIAYGAPGLYFNPNQRRVTTAAFNPLTDNNPPVVHHPSVNPKAEPAFGGFYSANNLRYDYAPGKFFGVAIPEIWQTILTGKFHLPTDIPGDDGIRNANIKGIIRLHSGGVTNQGIDTRGAINALRKEDGVEFMLVMDKFFATDCRYADIVLPLVTWWEQDGHTSLSNPEIFIGNLNKVIEPLFEAREDSWADGELCKRFGYDPRNAATKARKQSTFESFMNMGVMQSDGSTYKPLIKFNSVDEAQALIDKQGVEANANSLYAGGAGLVTYDEFLKQGYYQTRVSAAMRATKGSDGKGGGGSAKLYNFINQTAHLSSGFDAVNHSSDPGILATETGKCEIYSMNFTKYYEIFRSTKMEPIPKWQVEPYGFDGAAEHPDYAYNNGYDMQFLSCHPHNRVHSVGGDNKYMLELFDDVLYMNPIDAERRGLANGMTAKITTPPWVYNNLPANVKALALGSGGDRPEASLLRRVSVTNTIMPGVVLLPEGAMSRFDMDPDENIDYGGNPNSFALPLFCGIGQQTYNGFVVKIEKWTGTPLEPNYKWPANAPKFAE